jgi:hypothetical protein
MPSEYLWSSPGGVYRVPDDFRREFRAEFPDYRIRWSLKKSCWQIEQFVGVKGALPPVRQDDPHNDDIIRARDGYWLVMQTQPGSRMACPALVTRFPRQECGWELKIPPHWQGEVRCPVCVRAGRDGRTVVGNWAFDSILLDELRRTNPLTHGIVKRDGKVQTRAAWEADSRNAAREREADRRVSDSSTLDYVDLRWLKDIPTAGMTRRKIDDQTFR